MAANVDAIVSTYANSLGFVLDGQLVFACTVERAEVKRYISNFDWTYIPLGTPGSYDEMIMVSNVKLS